MTSPVSLLLSLSCSRSSAACGHQGAPQALLHGRNGEGAQRRHQDGHHRRRKIGDWMEAMTMEYPGEARCGIRQAESGRPIKAAVVVEDVRYYVTDISVVQP